MISKSIHPWKVALGRLVALTQPNLIWQRTTVLCEIHRKWASTSHIIDLRSDTVTKPTVRMREAMKTAVVGDDVFGEDPTVNKLEETFADILGKESSLLVPTGTMANLIAVLVHCTGRFNEVILGEDSHLNMYEVAGIAQLGGVQACCVPNLPDGTMDLHKVESKIRPLDDDHQPWTKAICVENTHNRCGGKVLPLDYLIQLKNLASKYKLPLHLDGARIFNAATASQVSAKDIAKNFDTVSVCFSKGLCCPAGSLIAGSREFIRLARRSRKALGGGMRQAGVIAAPMLVALEETLPRLAQDHKRAAQIARAISAVSNGVCSVDLSGVHSNIVMIETVGKVTASEFVDRMNRVTEKEARELGQHVSVLMSVITPTRVRYVTHNDISDDDVDKVIKKLQYVIEALSDN